MKKISLFVLMMAFAVSSFAQGEFITVWDATEDVGMGIGKVYFPAPMKGTYDIYWEEVDNPTHNGSMAEEQGPVEIIFGSAGKYIVKVTPNPINFEFNLKTYPIDKDKLVEVRQWGSYQWKTLGTAFESAVNMDVTATDVPDLSECANLAAVFNGCASLVNANGSISNWNTGNVTNMAYMFNGCAKFNQLLNNWDVSKVTTFIEMFKDAVIFNQPLNNWNVSEGTNFNAMFNGAVVFNGDISSWKTDNVTNMAYMFQNAEAFNQPLNDWNVANVTTFNSMFKYAVAFNQPLNSWDVSKVTTFQSMFDGATVFNGDISSWDISGTTGLQSFYWMFQNAAAFDQPLNDWKGWSRAKATSFYNMFKGASLFNQPLDKWITSRITSMENMFQDASSFNQPLNSWDVSKVTIFKQMFNNASSFNQPLDKWNVSSGTNLQSMFWNAAAFNQSLGSWTFKTGAALGSMVRFAGLDIANWDATLIGWADNPYTPVELMANNAEGLKYSDAGKVARDFLIKPVNEGGMGWVISHDTYDDGTSDIFAPQDNSLSIRVFSNRIVVDNVTNADVIQLFSISGKLIYAQQVTSDKVEFVVTPGFYIVNNTTRNQHAKVVVK